MTRTRKKPKVLESPLVVLFYQPNATFWRVFPPLGPASVRGRGNFFGVFRPKITVFIGGTLSKFLFLEKIEFFWTFLFPKMLQIPFWTASIIKLDRYLTKLTLFRWFLVKFWDFTPQNSTPIRRENRSVHHCGPPCVKNSLYGAQKIHYT